MPIAMNSKFFFLNHNETVVFNLVSLGGYRNIKGTDVWEIGTEFYKHISKTPFAPTGKKIQVCTRVECPLCNSGFKPTKMFKTNIVIVGEQYGEHDGTEKIFEMLPSAHEAVVGVIKSLRESGRTEEEILQSQFVLTRLKPNQKPYFVCSIKNGELIEEALEEEMVFDDEDIKLLKRLSDALEKQFSAGKIHNTRGAMQNTLRSTHKWSDIKIEAAFEKYLNEDGYLRDEHHVEPEQ